MPGFVQHLLSVDADGPALANSSVETSLLPSGSRLLLPPEAFNALGDLIKLVAYGRISTLVTTPGTLQLRLKFGSIAVFASGLMTLNTTAKTNVPWRLELDLVARSKGTGTAATLLGQGIWQSEAVIGAPAPTAGGAPSHMLPYNANPAVGAGFDSEQPQLVDLTAQWATANAANSIQLTQCHIFVPV